MSLGLNLEDSSNAPPGAFTTSTNPPTPTVSSERGRAGSLNSMIPVAPTPTPGGGGAHNTQQQHFIGGEHPQVSEIRRKWGLSPVTSPHHHPNPPNGGILLAPGPMGSGSFDGSLATYSNATSFVESDGGGPGSLSGTMTGVSQPLTTPTSPTHQTQPSPPSPSQRLGSAGSGNTLPPSSALQPSSSTAPETVTPTFNTNSSNTTNNSSRNNSFVVSQAASPLKEAHKEALVKEIINASLAKDQMVEFAAECLQLASVLGTQNMALMSSASTGPDVSGGRAIPRHRSTSRSSRHNSSWTGSLAPSTVGQAVVSEQSMEEFVTSRKGSNGEVSGKTSPLDGTLTVENDDVEEEEEELPPPQVNVTTGCTSQSTAASTNPSATASVGQPSIGQPSVLPSDAPPSTAIIQPMGPGLASGGVGQVHHPAGTNTMNSCASSIGGDGPMDGEIDSLMAPSTRSTTPSSSVVQAPPLLGGVQQHNTNSSVSLDSLMSGAPPPLGPFTTGGAASATRNPPSLGNSNSMTSSSKGTPFNGSTTSSPQTTVLFQNAGAGGSLRPSLPRGSSAVSLVSNVPSDSPLNRSPQTGGQSPAQFPGDNPLEFQVTGPDTPSLNNLLIFGQANQPLSQLPMHDAYDSENPMSYMQSMLRTDHVKVEEGFFESINNYVVVEEIGAGAHGRVYRAQEMAPDGYTVIREVAIKKLPRAKILKGGKDFSPAATPVVKTISPNPSGVSPPVPGSNSGSPSTFYLDGRSNSQQNLALARAGTSSVTASVTTSYLDGGAHRSNSHQNLALARAGASVTTSHIRVDNKTKTNHPAQGGIQYEIALMKKVKHENVMHLIEAIDDPTQSFLYLVMPFAEGGAVLETNPGNKFLYKQLKELTALGYLKQVVRGLTFLHSHGIVHHDMKPDNILRREDRLYIADFGMSGLVGDSSVTDATGWGYLMRTGTPAFHCPEVNFLKCNDQCLNHEEREKVKRFLTLDQGYDLMCTDTWALGVTFYVMLTGVLPFTRDPTFKSDDPALKLEQESLLDLTSTTYFINYVQKTITEDVVLPKYYKVSSRCRDLLKGMLARDPKKRLTAPQILQHRVFKTQASRHRRTLSDTKNQHHSSNPVTPEAASLAKKKELTPPFGPTATLVTTPSPSPQQQREKSEDGGKSEPPPPREQTQEPETPETDVTSPTPPGNPSFPGFQLPAALQIGGESSVRGQGGEDNSKEGKPPRRVLSVNDVDPELLSSVEDVDLHSPKPRGDALGESESSQFSPREGDDLDPEDWMSPRSFQAVDRSRILREEQSMFTVTDADLSGAVGVRAGGGAMISRNDSHTSLMSGVVSGNSAANTPCTNGILAPNRPPTIPNPGAPVPTLLFATQASAGNGGVYPTVPGIPVVGRRTSMPTGISGISQQSGDSKE